MSNSTKNRPMGKVATVLAATVAGLLILIVSLTVTRIFATFDKQIVATLISGFIGIAAMAVGMQKWVDAWLVPNRFSPRQVLSRMAIIFTVSVVAAGLVSMCIERFIHFLVG